MRTHSGNFPCTVQVGVVIQNNSNVSCVIYNWLEATCVLLFLFFIIFQGCSKSFQTPDKLTKHLDTSHKSLPCPNEDCTRVFLKQSQLKNHIKVHYSKYTCTKQDCNLKFDNEIDYRDHLNVHKGYTVPCPFKNCNLTFPTHNRLELHYRVAHLCQNGGDTGTGACM